MPRHQEIFASPLLIGMLLGSISATSSRAGEGMIEINAACAVQTGCTPTDAPGYPVELEQSGSYRLTSNLAQAAGNTAVLVVTASDVSIDLGGFVISGPFTCPGIPASCVAAGTGFAIDAGAQSGTRVENGAVRGTARGISVGTHCLVRNVRVIETTDVGILALDGCKIEDVVVARNGSTGLVIDQGAVSNSTASQNDGVGFSLGSGSTIAHSSASENRSLGISAVLGSQISGCTSYRNTGTGVSAGNGGSVTSTASYDNGGAGIIANTGSVVSFNTVTSNDGAGINAGPGVQAIGNTARANVGLGLVLGDNGGYRENILTSNNAGAEVQVGTQFVSDTIFNLGSNVCGSDTVCP